MTSRAAGLFGVAVFALSLLAVLAAFAAPLGELLTVWRSDEYSHGPLIPLLALLIGLHQLGQARPEPRPSWAGVALLALALGLLFVGQHSAFVALSLYGLVLAIAAVPVAAFGTAILRICWPSLLYLCFAIPLPNVLYSGLSSELQFLSSSLGVWFLELGGVPVYQDGNVIDLGQVRLQVIEACSGLRYLFPMVSFGYLAAYVFKGRLWKRLLLLLSTVPIALVMNSLRITLIGVAVNTWGVAAAEGVIHDVEGWTVFVLCIAVLLAEAALLARLGRGDRICLDYLTLPRPPFWSGRLTLAPSGFGLAALALAAALAAAAGWLAPDDLPPDNPRPLASFPPEIGGWSGLPLALDPELLAALRLQDYLLADFRRAGDPAPPVNFYVAYYSRQRIGGMTHSPASCIPGAGWRILDDAVRALPLADGRDQPVRRILVGKGEARQLVYYWFDQRCRSLTSQTALKWWLMVDSLRLHRSDGALVRLSTALAPGEAEAAGDRRLAAFLAQVRPALTTRLGRCEPAR